MRSGNQRSRSVHLYTLTQVQSSMPWHIRFTTTSELVASYMERANGTLAHKELTMARGGKWCSEDRGEGPEPTVDSRRQCSRQRSNKWTPTVRGWGARRGCGIGESPPSHTKSAPDLTLMHAASTRPQTRCTKLWLHELKGGRCRSLLFKFHVQVYYLTRRR